MPAEPPLCSNGHSPSEHPHTEAGVCSPGGHSSWSLLTVHFLFPTTATFGPAMIFLSLGGWVATQLLTTSQSLFYPKGIDPSLSEIFSLKVLSLIESTSLI